MRNDVTYIAIILGLFALAFVLVAACDRIIGPDSGELEEHGGGALDVGDHDADKTEAAA